MKFMAKKVLISGYIGFSNFGDEAIFALLTRHLKAKGLNVCALSSKPNRTKRRFKINAVYYKNPFHIIEEIAKCDYLISGGGSLLQNSTSNFSLLYYLLIILTAKLFFKKVIIFAQGIGPINGYFWQKLTSLCLKMCNLVTVRDEKSQKLLDSWGIKSTVVNDPVWDLPILNKENKGYIGIQLRNYLQMHPDFLEVFAKYIITYFSNKKIILFPFQNPQDMVLCRKFEKLLKDISPQIDCKIHYNNSIQSITQEFSYLDSLFAMRFHACLLGIKYGLKVFALPYDIKVENLCKQFNLSNIDVSNKPNNYDTKFSEFVEKKKQQTQNIHFNWNTVDNYIL